MLVHEAIEQAVAEEFVRLQGSCHQQLLNASQSQSQVLSAAIEPIAQDGCEAWNTATEQLAYFLFVTLRVNPFKPLADILAQPDTQAALRRPFEQATDGTRQAIGQAWAEGAAQGLEAANQDRQIMGYDPSGPVSLDQSTLAHTLDDATANGDAATQRFLDAIQTNDPEEVRDAVRHVGQDQCLRAHAGVDVAGKSAAHEMKQEALKGVTQRKVWVTSFSPPIPGRPGTGTCRYCAALHGQTRTLSQSFGTTIWGGALFHPPRHPNCRCRVIPLCGEDVIEVVAEMRKFAQSWIAQFFRALVGA